MMTKWGSLIMAMGLGLGAGCVSTSKYRKLQNDSTASQKQLQQQLADAQAKANGLEQQVSELDKNNDALAQEKEALKKASEDSKNQYSALVGQLQQEVTNGQLQITQYKNMLTVDVAEKIFFASGSATLKASGKNVLKKVADALAPYKDKMIRVAGYTDNVKLGKALQEKFPTNWELSVARAVNVVRFLQEKGNIEPERLIASGRGEYAPIAPNDTAEGRQKNRRIEIMLLDKNMVDAVKSNAETTPAAPLTATPPTATPADATPATSSPDTENAQ
jgi:chemotaxis protein MotB